MLSEYEHRPKALEHYCLAAFVSDLRIEYPKNVTFEDPFDDNFDDDPLDPAEKNILGRQVLDLPNGIVIKKRRVSRILRYVIEIQGITTGKDSCFSFLGEMRQMILEEVSKHMKNIIWPKNHS